jgi:hypothetical protein
MTEPMAGLGEDRVCACCFVPVPGHATWCERARADRLEAECANLRKLLAEVGPYVAHRAVLVEKVNRALAGGDDEG